MRAVPGYTGQVQVSAQTRKNTCLLCEIDQSGNILILFHNYLNEPDPVMRSRAQIGAGIAGWERRIFTAVAPGF